MDGDEVDKIESDHFVAVESDGSGAGTIEAEEKAEMELLRRLRWQEAVAEYEDKSAKYEAEIAEWEVKKAAYEQAKAEWEAEIPKWKEMKEKVTVFSGKVVALRKEFLRRRGRKSDKR